MKSFSLLVGVLPLAFAGLIEQRQANWTVGQAVEISSGRVIGHAAKNASASGVSEYLGIPFGKAPTGNLRFAAPEKFEGSSSLIINGSVYVSDPIPLDDRIRLTETVLGKLLPTSNLHWQRYT